MKISWMPANLKIHLAASGGDFFRAGVAPVFRRGNEPPPDAVSSSPCVHAGLKMYGAGHAETGVMACTCCIVVGLVAVFVVVVVEVMMEVVVG